MSIGEHGSRTPLPRAGLPMSVNDRDDHDGSGMDSIKDLIRKAVNESPTQIAVHNLGCKGCSANTLDGLVQRRTEDFPQTTTLLLVPAEGFEDVFPGFRKKKDTTHGLLVISA